MTKRDNRLYSTLEETKKKAIHGLLAVVRCPFLRAKQQKVSIVGDYQKISGGEGGRRAGPRATPLDLPLIMFSTVFILCMHGNENFTPPPSQRHRRNLIPVSNVCEAADSTNCRKCVSYTPST